MFDRILKIHSPFYDVDIYINTDSQVFDDNDEDETENLST